MSHLLFERQIVDCGLDDSLIAVESAQCPCIIQAYGSCTLSSLDQRIACLCPSLASWATKVVSCVESNPAEIANGASLIIAHYTTSCSALKAPTAATASTTESSTQSITESSTTGPLSTVPATFSTLLGTTRPSRSQGSLPSSQSASQPSLLSRTTAAPSSTASSTHSLLPPWNGSGPLLTGYCATPEYTLFDGATVLWAPVIGCVDGKPDCCPYAVQTTTTTVTDIASTITIDVGGSTQSSQGTQSEQLGSFAFPTPDNTAQATLARCPQDYQSISDGCCPSGYDLWNAALGGETPCFSTLQNPLTPPPVPDYSILSNPTSTAADTTTSIKPTAAIVNVVYAMHYPASPAPTPLPTSAIIGIGTGSTVAGLLIISLLVYLFWSRRRHRRELQRERDAAANQTLEEKPQTTQTVPITTKAPFSAGQPIGSTSNSSTGFAQPQQQMLSAPTYYEPAASSPLSWDGSGHVGPPSGSEGAVSSGASHELLDPQWQGRHELQS